MAAGVLIPLILLALGVGAAVVALWWWRYVCVCVQCSIVYIGEQGPLQL